MPKADVVDLVEFFAAGEANQIQAERFYDEAILALRDNEVIVQAHMIPVTDGVAEYPIPTDSIKVLSAFYGPNQLTRTTHHALEVASRTWRGEKATPLEYVEMNEPERQVRLYPAPSVTSAPFFSPSPFGTDYPDDQLVLFTIDRTDAAPPWLDLPIAMAVLGRSFLFSSATRDDDFAKAALALGSLLRNLGALREPQAR